MEIANPWLLPMLKPSLRQRAGPLEGDWGPQFGERGIKKIIRCKKGKCEQSLFFTKEKRNFFWGGGGGSPTHPKLMCFLFFGTFPVGRFFSLFHFSFCSPSTLVISPLEVAVERTLPLPASSWQCGWGGCPCWGGCPSTPPSPSRPPPAAPPGSPLPSQRRAPTHKESVEGPSSVWPEMKQV